MPRSRGTGVPVYVLARQTAVYPGRVYPGRVHPGYPPSDYVLGYTQTSSSDYVLGLSLGCPGLVLGLVLGLYRIIYIYLLVIWNM